MERFTLEAIVVPHHPMCWKLSPHPYASMIGKRHAYSWGPYPGGECSTIRPVHKDHDQAIRERLLSRNERALQEVIELHSAFVYGMARRVLGDSALAEEVAQDTFLALWRRPGAFDPARGSLRAFLLGVARNKAIDVVRKEQQLGRTREALIAEAEGQSKGSGADETIVSRDEIRTALGKLSEAQKQALVLAYFGGRTYREVAEELEIPEGTAKTRLRDGLANLRRTLERTEESDRK